MSHPHRTHIPEDVPISAGLFSDQENHPVDNGKKSTDHDDVLCSKISSQQENPTPPGDVESSVNEHHEQEPEEEESTPSEETQQNDPEEEKDSSENVENAQPKMHWNEYAEYVMQLHDMQRVAYQRQNQHNNPFYRPDLSSPPRRLNRRERRRLAREAGLLPNTSVQNNEQQQEGSSNKSEEGINTIEKSTEQEENKNTVSTSASTRTTVSTSNNGKSSDYSHYNAKPQGAKRKYLVQKPALAPLVRPPPGFGADDFYGVPAMLHQDPFCSPRHNAHSSNLHASDRYYEAMAAAAYMAEDAFAAGAYMAGETADNDLSETDFAGTSRGRVNHNYMTPEKTSRFYAQSHTAPRRGGKGAFSKKGHHSTKEHHNKGGHSDPYFGAYEAIDAAAFDAYYASYMGANSPYNNHSALHYPPASFTPEGPSGATSAYRYGGGGEAASPSCASYGAESGYYPHDRAFYTRDNGPSHDESTDHSHHPHIMWSHQAALQRRALAGQAGYEKAINNRSKGGRSSSMNKYGAPLQHSSSAAYEDDCEYERAMRYAEAHYPEAMTRSPMGFSGESAGGNNRSGQSGTEARDFLRRFPAPVAVGPSSRGGKSGKY